MYICIFFWYSPKWQWSKSDWLKNMFHYVSLSFSISSLKLNLFEDININLTKSPEHISSIFFNTDYEKYTFSSICWISFFHVTKIILNRSNFFGWDVFGTEKVVWQIIECQVTKKHSYNNKTVHILYLMHTLHLDCKG